MFAICISLFASVVPITIELIFESLPGLNEMAASFDTFVELVRLYV